MAQMRAIKYRFPRLFTYFCSSYTLVTIHCFEWPTSDADGGCCGGCDQDHPPPPHHHHHHCHPHHHRHYLQDLVCGGRGHRGVKHDAVAEDWGGDRYKVIRHITHICNQPDASQTSHTSKIESYQTHQTHAPTNTSQTGAESDIRRVILSDYYSPKIRNITSHKNWWGGQYPINYQIIRPGGAASRVLGAPLGHLSAGARTTFQNSKLNHFLHGVMVFLLCLLSFLNWTLIGPFFLRTTFSFQR